MPGKKSWAKIFKEPDLDNVNDLILVPICENISIKQPDAE